MDVILEAAAALWWRKNKKKKKNSVSENSVEVKSELPAAREVLSHHHAGKSDVGLTSGSTAASGHTAYLLAQVVGSKHVFL